MEPQRFRYKQVDVFGEHPFGGNPVGVVLGADGMTDGQMAAIARWTNLSETTFVLSPHHADADYRVRIFTTIQELPFAGHPTLGTCHAWLEAGGMPKATQIVQECGIGLVRVRRDAGPLAFAAPPLLRSGEVATHELDTVRRALGLAPSDVLGAHWVDNGAGWMALRLSSPERVLRVQPDFSTLGATPVGIFAEVGDDVSRHTREFEIRAFIAGDAVPEDPVTGSLAAGVSLWLDDETPECASYVFHQGRMLGRSGRIEVRRYGNQRWVGGTTLTLIDGELVNASSR